LIEWLQEHAPLALELYKSRKEKLWRFTVY
jgi:hypothetical protein